MQTIKKKLENGIEPAGKSTCGYIKRAYQGLLLAIESSGWKGCSAGMDLVNMLRSSSDQNNYIRKGYRINHLDDDQRNALFTLLMQPEYLYDLFLVALFYSGLDEADIAGQTYGDFEVLTLKDGCCCYTLMINRRVRKLNERYSTLQATNKSFPIQKLRRIVLAPWAGKYCSNGWNSCAVLDLLMNRLKKCAFLPKHRAVPSLAQQSSLIACSLF